MTYLAIICRTYDKFVRKDRLTAGVVNIVWIKSDERRNTETFIVEKIINRIDMAEYIGLALLCT